MFWGLKQLLERRVPLLPFAEWFIGGAILHDALLAPLVFIVGGLVARVAPATLRAVAAAVFVVAGGVSLYAVPALFGDGRESANPSMLPNQEPRNVVLVLAAIVLVGIAGAAFRLFRGRARSSGPDRTERRPGKGSHSLSESHLSTEAELLGRASGGGEDVADVAEPIPTDDLGE